MIEDNFVSNYEKRKYVTLETCVAHPYARIALGNTSEIKKNYDRVV
jgi:hypothetical protein